MPRAVILMQGAGGQATKGHGWRRRGDPITQGPTLVVTRCGARCPRWNCICSPLSDSAPPPHTHTLRCESVGRLARNSRLSEEWVGKPKEHRRVPGYPRFHHTHTVSLAPLPLVPPLRSACGTPGPCPCAPCWWWWAEEEEILCAVAVRGVLDGRPPGGDMGPRQGVTPVGAPKIIAPCAT